MFWFLTITGAMVLIVLGALGRYWWKYGSFWPATFHAHAQVLLKNDALIGQNGNGEWLIPHGMPVVGFRVYTNCSSVRVILHTANTWPTVARYRYGGDGYLYMEFPNPITVNEPFAVSFSCRQVSIEPGRVVSGRPLAASLAAPSMP